MALPLAIPIAMAAAGAIGGAMSQQKVGQQTAGNLFYDPNDPGRAQRLAGVADQFAQGKSGDIYGQANKNVRESALLSNIFGQGGTMDRTGAEEQQLASRGYSLQPEDYEAYGQASGNIARMFGQQEQNLAQALASRGLSNSTVAGREFSGVMGNKAEQLAGLQRQIANDRMNKNMERLGQTRQFLLGLGNQAQGALGQALGAQQQGFSQEQARANAAMDYLRAQQGQSNENLAQEKATEHETPQAAMLLGGMRGFSSGMGMMGGGLGGAAGGAGGLGSSSPPPGAYMPQGRTGLAGR